MIQQLTMCQLMRQLFKEYCNEVKECYNDYIVPYWDDVKECFKEFVGFKS